MESAEGIEKRWNITCKACKRNYEKLEMINLNWIRTSIAIKETAVFSLKEIFGSNFDLAELFKPKTITGIAQYSNDTYHIIFRIHTIKAYLDCRKMKSYFIVIDVWRMY